MNNKPTPTQDPPDLSTLQGQIERVTFYNDETDFAIVRLTAPGYHELVTAVGTLTAPRPGQVIRATGEWINHPKFREQFKILRYTTLAPATVAGIEKYLGSGLIKGIGPVMAKRMVKEFGEDALRVIEEERLSGC
jgi:exodeoxyribonuclease V alpha subunit